MCRREGGRIERPCSIRRITRTRPISHPVARLASDLGRSNAMSPLGSNVTISNPILKAQSTRRARIHTDGLGGALIALAHRLLEREDHERRRAGRVVAARCAELR